MVTKIIPLPKLNPDAAFQAAEAARESVVRAELDTVQSARGLYWSEDFDRIAAAADGAVEIRFEVSSIEIDAEGNTAIIVPLAA